MLCTTSLLLSSKGFATFTETTIGGDERRSGTRRWSGVSLLTGVDSARCGLTYVSKITDGEQSVVVPEEEAC